LKGTNNTNSELAHDEKVDFEEVIRRFLNESRQISDRKQFKWILFVDAIGQPVLTTGIEIFMGSGVQGC
jgi:hypothetical protein